ncbi:hypothetical protein PSAB6_450152 [Paraburkholderia sabiae]|nr:hypothetical protein PSAB6_450152 [Paraburkholderia sabiae]
MQAVEFAEKVGSEVDITHGRNLLWRQGSEPAYALQSGCPVPRTIKVETRSIREWASTNAA